MNDGAAVKIDFSDDTGSSAEFVRHLRDAATAQSIASWSGIVLPPEKATLLHHLQPPHQQETVGNTGEVSEWRLAHRPGICYYRMGPGFIQIQDRRWPDRPVRITISDEATVDIFLRCLDPQLIDTLDVEDRVIVTELVEENLIGCFGGHIVTLPYRMKKWPIPAPSV